MGLCVWSPKLDAQGNSVRGVEFARQLVERFSLHTYDSLGLQSEKKNPLVNPIQRESEEVTRLIEVASRGDLTALDQYRVRGADLDAGDYDSRTPLHLAAAEGHAGVVEFLLAHGVNPSPVDRWGSTPMNDALRNGHGALAELLRRHGGIEGANDYRPNAAATPVSITSDVTAFIWAASIGNLEAMLPYVARGVPLDCADYDARTALHLAASEGRVEVVRYLLSHMDVVDPVDRWGHTPLDDARRHGHAEVVAMLEKALGALERKAA